MSEIECLVKKITVGGKLLAAPFIDIPFLPVSPAIDGAYSARKWRDAALLPPFVAPVSGERAQVVTRCRLGMDRRNLYAVLRCEAHSPAGSRVKRRNHVAADDRIELFIRPDNSRPCLYYMFVVDAKGECNAKIKTTKESGGTANMSEAQFQRSWKARVRSEPGGWTVEMAIPWSTLGVRPGSVKGIRLNVARSLTVGAKGERSHSAWAYCPEVKFNWPEKFGVGLCAFKRQSGKKYTPEDLGLDTSGLVNVRRMHQIFPVPDRFEAVCGTALPNHPLLAGMDKIQLVVRMAPFAANGKLEPPVELDRFKLNPRTPVRLSIAGLAQCDCVLNLRFQSAGFNYETDIPVMAGVLRKIEKQIRAVPDMAEKSPYRAAAYMGLASCMDRLRREVALESTCADLMRTICEAKTRLDVLNNSETPAGTGLLKLLELGRNPESQVVVEYLHRKKMACVTFHCGAVPLVSVQAQECDNAGEAGRLLSVILDRHKGSPMLGSGAEILKIAGLPACINTKIYDVRSHRSMIARFDDSRQVLLADFQRQSRMALDMKYIDCAVADAAVILPDCPRAVDKTVTAWGDATGTPVIRAGKSGNRQPDTLNDFKRIRKIKKYKHILVAGNSSAIADQLPQTVDTAVYPMTEDVNGKVCAAVASGNVVYSVWHAHRGPAVKALKMVLAGKPLEPADVDILRADIIRHCGPRRKNLASTGNVRFFCGDMHTHTSFSHGEYEATPVGLALQSMYCFMDFLVISDHDCVKGALMAQRLFRRHKIDYTVIAGAEVGAGRSHLNTYPLKRAIRAATEKEAFQIARRRGAVMQWNHPDTDMLKMREAVGENFDAWEHYPRQYYDEWKRAGILPALIGSSDTHDGTFAFFVCGYFERTLMAAPSRDEQHIVNAVRRKNTVLVTPAGNGFFYGTEPLTTSAWAALAEGRGLKAAKARHLRRTLASADIMGLITRNHPTRGRD